MADEYLRQLSDEFNEAYLSLFENSLNGSREGLSDLTKRVIELADKIRERMPEDYVDLQKVESSIIKIRKGDPSGARYLGQVTGLSRHYSY